MDTADLSDGALSDEFDRPDDGGDEPGPHRLHAEHLPLSCGRDDLRRLDGVERKRFLAQDGFAGFDHGERIGSVAMVRRGDVDDIDCRIIGEFEQVVEHLPSVTSGEGLGRRPSARRHGDQLSIVDVSEVGCETVSHCSGPDDPEPDGCLHCCVPAAAGNAQGIGSIGSNVVVME